MESVSRDATSQRSSRSSIAREIRWCTTRNEAASVYHWCATSPRRTAVKSQWKARREKAASLLCRYQLQRVLQDRKSTRLNSSHANISYAVFCLKKKNYH